MPAKDPSQRRRRNTTSEGEWIDISNERVPVSDAVLPVANRGWSDVMREVWVEWRADPVSLYFTPADVQYAIDTIQLYRDFDKYVSEIRQRTTAMGFSPEGKRKLHFRVNPDMEVQQEKTPLVANVVQMDDRRKALAHAG